MEIDMHYYGVLALARSVGYSPDEARTIAYASQYVDDATEDQPIRLVDREPFEPVRTAHIGLHAFLADVQRGVYMPFHFIPPRPKNVEAAFAYVTEPDSELVRLLLEEVGKDHTELRLHRIGVALHTYADTWSHQNFSGRNSPRDNDVENCFIDLDDTTHRMDDRTLNILPTIGHVQAGHYPDYTHLKWAYDIRQRGTFHRDNPKEFLDAARNIFEHLVEFRGAGDRTWASIEGEIDRLLRQRTSAEEKSIGWRQSFLLGGLFSSPDSLYVYDMKAWPGEALKPVARHTSAEKFSFISPEMEYEVIREIPETNFGKFHKAAQLQKEFVLSRIA
jgi:hypothetical protein